MGESGCYLSIALYAGTFTSRRTMVAHHGFRTRRIPPIDSHLPRAFPPYHTR